jgi:tetratricopeptide (TPR) repeat protein
VIPILMALAAAAGPPPLPPLPIPRPHAVAGQKEESCLALARSAPEQAAETASQWRAKGGGIPALLCQGLAYTALERWPDAGATFETAAVEAERTHDIRRADFWVEAGNAWLAGGNPARARQAFDTALAVGSLQPQVEGEIHLDRARALVATGDVAGARTAIDRGLALVPSDPFAWYLSAALARRENDLGRARTDIAKAVTLAADDSAVLLEAGNIAGLSGDGDAARKYYESAVRAGPRTPAGMAAASALAANGGTVPTPAR